MLGEHAETEEARSQDDGHDHEGDGRVAGLRLLERGNAVGDRLNSREGDGTRGECLEEVEERHGIRAMQQLLGDFRVVGDRGQVLEEHLEESDADQGEEHDDVQVGRWCKERTRLLESSQVGERQDDDEPDTQLDAVRGEPVERRDDRGDSTCDRYRDGEDVVHEHRTTGNE